MTSLRLRTYRGIQRGLIERAVLPRFFSETRRQDARDRNLLEAELPDRTSGVARYWFHAASVGELESLWTVAETCARVREGRSAAQLVLTVFSESAGPAIRKLGEATAPASLFAGYSPWEGSWEEALARVNPDAFVTAKYEAWPELWLALSRLRIPLILVSATPRKSLKVAKSLCRALGGELPEMRLLCAREVDAVPLREIFPAARTTVTGDPRWDRVSARTRVGSARARALVEQALVRQLPRPWGVLGSAWEKDVLLWAEAGGPALAGTVFVVPHRTDEASVEPIERELSRSRAPVWRTSRGPIPEAGARTLLVDEMGFLSELYASCDWAYVGGGFGAGVHSTIEPALQGLPVAAGPAKSGSFPEIGELREAGQLELVSGVEELRAWLESGERSRWMPEKRALWREDARRRLGATDRVLGLFP